jgi:hypothetical protein
MDFIFACSNPAMDALFQEESSQPQIPQFPHLHQLHTQPPQILHPRPLQPALHPSHPHRHLRPFPQRLLPLHSSSPPQLHPRLPQPANLHQNRALRQLPLQPPHPLRFHPRPMLQPPSPRLPQSLRPPSLFPQCEPHLHAPPLAAGQTRTRTRTASLPSPSHPRVPPQMLRPPHSPSSPSALNAPTPHLHPSPNGSSSPLHHLRPLVMRLPLFPPHAVTLLPATLSQRRTPLPPQRQLPPLSGRLVSGPPLCQATPLAPPHRHRVPHLPCP